MNERRDQLRTSDDFHNAENCSTRASIDQKVGNNHEGARSYSGHDVRDHRRQVMILMQSPERPVQQETMNQIIKESADAESEGEHGNDPSCVRWRWLRRSQSSREIRELADTRKRGSQRQLNRGIADVRHAHCENHRRIRAYQFARTCSPCQTPVLVKVERNESALH